jgi:hypothetical protein
LVISTNVLTFTIKAFQFNSNGMNYFPGYFTLKYDSLSLLTRKYG